MTSAERAAALPAPLVGVGFLRHVAVLAGASAAGQGLVLAATPVLTRLYSPAEFGALAIYTAVASTAVVLASLRYEAAIALPETDEDGLSLLVLSLLLGGASAIIAAAAVALVGGHLATWTATPELGPILWFLPFAVAGGAAYQALSYWNIRQAAFNTIARTKVTQGVAGLATQASFGAAGLGAGGLVIGDLFSRTAGIVSLGGMALHSARDRRWRPTIGGIRPVAARYRQFPLVGSLSAVMNVAALYLPAPLFAALYGTEVAGWLGLGQRMVILPAMMVGAAFSQVFLARAARLAHDDPRGGLRLFKETLRRLGLIAVVAGVGGALLAPEAFTVVFGEEWRQAGEFARYLAANAAIALVVSPLSQVALIGRRQGLQLVGDSGRLALVVAAVLVAHRLAPGDPLAGIIAYSAVMFATYLLFLGFYYRTAVALSKGLPA
ncbi:MAG: oligosaccharide flippase family protein [Chloroflexi bacterium]|nr:oligosaccharide flippase family protein [Chloroflexota bacterium]